MLHASSILDAMTSSATTIDEYIASLPEDRAPVISMLHEIISANLPEGFEACMSYGMIGYVVPHSLYPAGYHCTPKLPLPFINLASQKNYISLYHMGLYADEKLLDWFTHEYAKTRYKIDMGKGCIRFKNLSEIPYALMTELAKKVPVEKYIARYESLYVKK
jgi:uncharacterized protein YdhG (YjbR/CyaY superfamily)